MTSRERLWTAIRRGQPDRVPIHVRGVPVWNQGWVNSRHWSYRPLIEAVHDQCDWVAGWGPATRFFLSAAPVQSRTQTVGLDERWSLQTTAVETPRGQLTSSYQISNIGMPGLRHKFWVECEEDLERFLSLPYEPLNPDVSGFFALDKAIGDRGIVIVGFSDPIAYVHDLLGSELLALWSVERSEHVRGLVGLFAERLRNLLEHLLSCGVKGLYGFSGAEYAGPPLLSPRDFRVYVTEPETELFQLIHENGSWVHVHCHGPLDAILEDFAVMGADCLHPIEAPPMGDMPLSEAKKRIGKDVCLEGNIQIGDLYAEDTTRVQEYVAQAIADGAEGGGFILCPSASPHTPELSPRTVANYLAMINVGLAQGRYA
jgi:hypothetical protein